MQELVSIYKLAGDKIIYKINNVNRDKLKSADNEERVVYQIIADAGNKGIWIRDIRLKSNLNQKQLDKVLKSLEHNNSIKSVKTVTVRRIQSENRKNRICLIF